MVQEALKWLREESLKKGEEFIGVTTTLLALLTAAATLAGHRAHTEEVKVQTLATDQWGFYQAKHIRAHMYGIEAERALARGDVKYAQRYLTIAIYEQCGEPAAKNCHLEKCTLGADAKGCNFPVLKDSPELRQFLLTSLLQKDDDKFRERFHVSDSGKTSEQEEPLPPGLKAEEEPCKTPTNKPGAAHILETAQCHDKGVRVTTNEARLYDIGEIILEASIMFCGVALVVGTETYRKSAYMFVIGAVAVAAAGVGVALFAALRYPVGPYVAGFTYAAAALVSVGLIVWVLLWRHEPNGPRLHKPVSSPEPSL